MIDLHCHVLPAADDGAPSMDVALAMLRLAERDGTKRLVATPHQRHPAGYHVTPALAERKLAELAEAARREGIGIELSLGAEVHLSEDMPEGLAAGSLSPLAPGCRHFLLELPVTFIPGNLLDLIFAAQTGGWFPVLAHPERNFEVMDRPEKARDLRDRGVLLQVTAQSVTGAFGRASRKASLKLLKWGAVDVIASDAHNADRRPPGLSAAVKEAAKVVGASRAEEMVTVNPARILAAGKG